MSQLKAITFGNLARRCKKDYESNLCSWASKAKVCEADNCNFWNSLPDAQIEEVTPI